ncbi:MAG: DUF1801 domain-containing protein [Chitinophagales bacterium]|nr:DUF1801 domain-containing protein [Chitinophagales bacterium]
MTLPANTPTEYLQAVDEARREAFSRLRDTIIEHIPADFREEMSYGMIGYVVPHSIYPSGYHCDPKLPLPFVSIAAQKNFLALYHMGMYANPQLLEWFVQEFPKHSKSKLDMGKSCVRFKKANDIPYALIGQLMEKMNAEDWIQLYESAFQRKG